MDTAVKASMDNLQYAEHVMPLWIDGARTFAATASAALGLTIVFKEKVLASSGRMKKDKYLLGSWLAYLSCIGTSVIYQWMAVHWIIALRDDPATNVQPDYYPFVWLPPHDVFGIMVGFFFLGSFLLIQTSIRQLKEVRFRELKEIHAACVGLPWSLVRARLRGERMALPIILSAISALNSALRVAEFVEEHGSMPIGDDLISHNLALAQEQPILASAAIEINSRLGDAENELFGGTLDRVDACLRFMNRALNDPDVFPDQRKRYGVTGRKCTCGEVGVISNLLDGSLPDDLAKIWNKYRCWDVYQRQALDI